MKLRTLVITMSLFFATSAFSPVFAKQCIWNKAGFTVNINWIKDENIVRKNQILSGQGNCSDDNGINYTVVLSMQDGKLASNFTKGAIIAAAAALGSSRKMVGGAGGLQSSVTDLINKGLPDPQEVFYTGVPGSDRYLDVWGTVWSPQTGPGGPIQ